MILIGMCVIALLGSSFSSKKPNNHVEEVVDDRVEESIEIEGLNEADEDKKAEINYESIQDNDNNESTIKGTTSSIKNNTNKSISETSHKDVDVNGSSNNDSSSKTEIEKTNEEASIAK